MDPELIEVRPAHRLAHSNHGETLRNETPAWPERGHGVTLGASQVDWQRSVVFQMLAELEEGRKSNFCASESWWCL